MARQTHALMASIIVVLCGCTATRSATPTASPTVTATPPERQPSDLNTLATGYAQVLTATAAAATATPGPAPQTSSPTVQPQPATHPPQPTTAPADETGTPRIESFIATADRVIPGDTISLSWKTNVARVSIRVILPTGQYGPWFDQPGNGSMDYTVDPKERNPFQIQLVAGPGEDAPYKNLLFDIICPDAWFVGGAPATCPNPALSGDWVVERFEQGSMVWIGGNQSIIILRDDGVWSASPDTWEPGMPESDPSLVPPAGLFQPVRGFGKVWRESNDHAGLGWALAPEFAAPITYQCDSRFKSAICILSGPDGLLVLNMWGGGWKKSGG